MKIKLIDFGLEKGHYPFRPHENDVGADVYMPYDCTLKPGEIVLEIVVPMPSEGTTAVYDKYRTRKSIDFAILAVAGTLRLEEGIVKEISLVLGAAAPIPMKLQEAEQYLLGKELTEETAKEAAEIALKKAIPLEMNGYKIEMAKVMIRRFLGF